MKTYNLCEGKLITDDASIALGAIVAFQEDTVILENGEALRLTEGLANALRDYLRDTRQTLARIRSQA